MKSGAILAAPDKTTEAVPMDQLLTWRSNVSFADLPGTAMEVMCDNLVDGLGCGLFGSTPRTISHSARRLG